MKPIIFSTPMVQAILDGRKTQTRRVIKPQPPKDAGEIYGPKLYTSIKVDKNGFEQPGPEVYGIYGDDWGCELPYQPGDILWVRETWVTIMIKISRRIKLEVYCYKAGKVYLRNGYFIPIGDDCVLKWRPSIHMPKEAARVFLKVESVRIEELQDITEEDVRAEGCITGDTYAGLWDSLNAKRGYPFSSNPWVWVVEFKRILKEEACS